MCNLKPKCVSKGINQLRKVASHLTKRVPKAQLRLFEQSLMKYQLQDPHGVFNDCAKSLFFSLLNDKVTMKTVAVRRGGASITRAKETFVACIANAQLIKFSYFPTSTSVVDKKHSGTHKGFMTMTNGHVPILKNLSHSQKITNLMFQ